MERGEKARMNPGMLGELVFSGIYKDRQIQTYPCTLYTFSTLLFYHINTLLSILYLLSIISEILADPTVVMISMTLPDVFVFRSVCVCVCT